MIDDWALNQSCSHEINLAMFVFFSRYCWVQFTNFYWGLYICMFIKDNDLQFISTFFNSIRVSYSAFKIGWECFSIWVSLCPSIIYPKLLEQYWASTEQDPVFTELINYMTPLKLLFHCWKTHVSRQMGMEGREKTEAPISGTAEICGDIRKWGQPQRLCSWWKTTEVPMEPT